MMVCVFNILTCAAVYKSHYKSVDYKPVDYGVCSFQIHMAAHHLLLHWER